MNYYAAYVNLDSRPDRNEHMIKELARVGINAVRHRGIPWKELNYHLVKHQTMYQRTPGALGCYYSQMEVMQKAYDAGEHAFVMEDDLVFCSDFPERLNIIHRFSQSQQWDVIWLGGTYHKDKAYWHSLPHNKLLTECDCGLDVDYQDIGIDHFVRTWGCFSTHAYIVNYRSIPKILSLLEAEIPNSIGIDYSFIKLQPKLDTFAFVPGCVKQMDNESDIGTGITHFSRFNKIGAHWFQKKMEDYVEIKHRIELVGLLKKFGITGPVAELGVAEGYFSADLLRAEVEFLYAIDRWGHIPNTRGDGNFPQEWHDKNYADATERMKGYKNVAMLRTTTVEAATEFRDNTFAMVYHDADHSYAGVKRDIDAWWTKIKPGGIMAFHDYFMPEYGVRKAVEEFCGSSIDINFIMENKTEDAGAWIRKPL